MIAQTERPRVVTGGGVVFGALAGLLFGVVGMSSLGIRGSSPDDAWAAPAAGVPAAAAAAGEVQFAAHAVGTIARATVLSARPGGGDGLGPVAAGTVVQIGGRVRVPSGLGTRDVLWVGIGDEGGQRFGFLVSDDVILGAGEPPLLALAGVRPESMLAPGMAVRHGSAGDAAALVAADVATAAPGAPAAVSGSAKDVGGRVELPWLPDTVTRWSDLLVAAGARHGVDPELLAILTLVESGGNPKAVSPAGATGLMQIMPATAAGIARERGLAGHATSRLYEPAYNIDFGAYYIAQQLRAFGRASDPDWQQSVELAAAAYNGGPGSVQRQQAGGALPAETRSYQRWVGGMWRDRHAAANPTLQQWLAAGGQVLVDRARQVPADG